ncbi:MAG TPA: hypothetical protein VKB88_42250, partial [Bryobacteraceae bacterium]|nr:hypothetical protein [Bryobacteraceae bacterium]
MRSYGARSLGRLIGASNRAHRLTVAYVWEIPGPADGFLKRALGGWSLAGISTFQSGAPFTVAN